MSAIRTTSPADELDLLRQLYRVTKARRRLGHGEILLRRGFARNDTGAWVITTWGRAKLALEVTRASWLSNAI